MNLLKSLTNVFKKKDEAPSENSIEKVSKESKEPAPFWKEKLNDEQRLQVIHFIAQGLTNSAVVSKVEDEMGIKISTVSIQQYRSATKWQETLKKLREEYLNRLDLIDGSHKSVRLRRMEHVMDKSIKKGDLRVAISANEQMRKEFQNEDGATTIYWNNPTYQQFNQLSNEELIKKQKEATEKLKLKEKA